MHSRMLRPNMAMVLVAFAVLFGAMMFCARSLQSSTTNYWSAARSGGPANSTAEAPSENSIALAASGGASQGPVQSPTPDPPHPLPPLRIDPEVYTVQAGDTLGTIAQRYEVSIQMLVEANSLVNPDLVEVGQVLQIPVPTPDNSGPAFKIIPDSELVYSPSNASFDTAGFVQSQGGYLAGYSEEVEGAVLSGAKIVEKVAQDYSVNPRLLLAAIEYQTGWVTKKDLPEKSIRFPAGVQDPQRRGLYLQLTWTANALNRGYYVYRVNGAANWLLADGTVVPINPTINAGTAAVQNFFASLYDQTSWLEAVSETGLFATFNQLFGYPFQFTYEPLLPPDLAQPALQLPFESGKAWAFTGGPHGGWGSGSAWAALDFAPPSDALGCVTSDEWVVAVADGLVVRTGNGAVFQDLDGDGLEQTGWVILYMHIESRDRVEPGTFLKAGDPVGHPSCEGGVSTGTHVHIARKYNGEWIPADQPSAPFLMDGWTSSGDGYEYNGSLHKDGQYIEAYAGRSENNAIYR